MIFVHFLYGIESQSSHRRRSVDCQHYINDAQMLGHSLLGYVNIAPHTHTHTSYAKNRLTHIRVVVGAESIMLSLCRHMKWTRPKLRADDSEFNLSLFSPVSLNIAISSPLRIAGINTLSWCDMGLRRNGQKSKSTPTTTGTEQGPSFCCCCFH